MKFERDDLRAAVAAGMITEAQAASVLALAQSRAGVRQAMPPQEEPFELFKGFNEIFIVVGLSILYAGWTGITGFTSLFQNDATFTTFLVFTTLGLGGIAIAAGYFTLKRRMVAPSIALTLMWALSAAQLSFGLFNRFGLETPLGVSFSAGFCALMLLGWYIAFRIPFSIALTALGVFATVGSVFVWRGATLDNPFDIFLLTNDGPFAWITIVLGLIGFAIAMSFDMGDPYRVSRRSASGFWLHVIAAPAIVNTIALTMFEVDTTLSYLTLVAFLLIIAAVAIVIDRRSFLVAGVGYVVALIFTVSDPSGIFWMVFLLGILLVFLGAKWEVIRRRLMQSLPAFPGKDRLPPYGLVEATK